MHAEAVKVGARPSKIGLKHDIARVLNCQECNVCYHLYYDIDMVDSLTHWNALAQEIITARHPLHSDYIDLNRSQPF